MPASILSIPFLIGLLSFLYIAWGGQPWAAVGIIPMVLALAAIIIMSPQINWWWYSRRPPRLPEQVVALFLRSSAFFQSLGRDDKRKFLDRTALFMMGNKYIPQGMGDADEVPEDIKAIIAAQAVTITFGQPEFLFPAFENIVVYPQAFLSPQYPDRFHASEIFEEDGVLMFSAEHLMRSFVQPSQFFGVGLYEYARVYVRAYPMAAWPLLAEGTWGVLGSLGHFNKEYLHQYFNLEEIDLQAVAIAHFFLFPERFEAQLPDLHQQYRQIFSAQLS